MASIYHIFNNFNKVYDRKLVFMKFLYAAPQQRCFKASEERDYKKQTDDQLINYKQLTYIKLYISKQ